MLSEVKFNLGDGGLEIPSPNVEQVSALIFSENELTGGFEAGYLKRFNSLKAVENEGINATDAETAIAYYQCSEFFRMNPQGTLWLGVGTINQIFNLLIEATEGNVFQIGYCTSTSLNDVQTAQTEANKFLAAYAMCHITLGLRVNSATPLREAGGNLQNKNSPYVSVLISGSGSGRGSELANELETFIPGVGAFLGALSASKVHQNVGDVGRVNFKGNNEYSAIAYVGGYEPPVTAELAPFDDNHYVFHRKYIGSKGVHIEKDRTATVSTSDYSNIRHVRTMAKIVRLLNEKLVLRLKSALYVDRLGKLAPDTIEFYKAYVGQPLFNMKRAGEISDYGILIDPDQNIVSTSRFKIKYRIVPVGSADFIENEIIYSTTSTFGVSVGGGGGSSVTEGGVSGGDGVIVSGLDGVIVQ